MNSLWFSLAGYPVSYAAALAGAFAALGLLLLWSILALGRLSRARALEAEASEERQAELEARMAALAQASAELNGRLGGLGEWLGARQSDLVRLMSERLDQVGARVGTGLETHARTTGEGLAKLNERLAVIDAAQARLAGMTDEVISLKDILANKQSRGAFGQGQMEAIVRDGLPAGAYEFQYTLANKSRPDCVIRLPGDERVLAVDAKFPLEAFTALRKAGDDEARRAAAQRVRSDIGKHVKDIAERYLSPGETQDIALMFVPSESIYADLVEHFDELVQKAHRARVVIVSPSLLRMAIEVTRTMQRDARLRDGLQEIHAEVGRLVEDARRLGERAARLETHFRQAQDDVGVVVTSAEKVVRRAVRLEAMDMPGAGAGGATPERRLSGAAE